MHGEQLPPQPLPGFEHAPDYDDMITHQSPYEYSTLREGWHNGNMFNNHVLWMPNCNMERPVFSDKVWRFGDPHELRIEELPNPELFGALFYSDAIRRLQAVEQLTLTPEYSTIPNTAAMSRFEHVWGSVLFARQIGEKFGITGRELSVYMLRTLVSDVAHTLGSHLGDWIFQGAGGKEDLHDQELKRYLEIAGVNEILEKYGIRPDEVIFPDIADFIEAPQPDLNTDRVDYGLREMNRWNQVVFGQAFNSNDFTLTPERMLAMNDQRRARIFAEGYLQLPLRNWSEPTHRFMIDMTLLRTKLFYAEGGAPDEWIFGPDPGDGLQNLRNVHPRDLMYMTDISQLSSYAAPSLPGHTIESIMKSVAQYQRQYVWPGIESRLYGYMSQFANDYDDVRRNGHKPFNHPDFVTYRDDYPASVPNGFAILDKEYADATQHEVFIDFPQKPLKLRRIDPLVRAGNGFARLSELDPDYAERLVQYEQELRTPRVARLAIPDPKTNHMLRSVIDGVEHHWQQRLATTERMEPAHMRELLRVAARRVIGHYPFMTFYDIR